VGGRNNAVRARSAFRCGASSPLGEVEQASVDLLERHAERVGELLLGPVGEGDELLLGQQHLAREALSAPRIPRPGLQAVRTSRRP